MPTKRRRLSTRQIGLPPAAIEAWRIGDRGGLNSALGIRPWQRSPFDVPQEQPPKWLRELCERGSDLIAGTEDWARAWELRCQMIELAGPPGRFDRHGQPLGPAPPLLVPWESNR